MSYEKFFDGTYENAAGQALVVTTLRNPSGFLVRSLSSGACLTITVDDALALFDRLDMHNNHGKVELGDLEMRK